MAPFLDPALEVGLRDAIGRAENDAFGVQETNRGRLVDDLFGVTQSHGIGSIRGGELSRLVLDNNVAPITGEVEQGLRGSPVQLGMGVVGADAEDDAVEVSQAGWGEILHREGLGLKTQRDKHRNNAISRSWNIADAAMRGQLEICRNHPQVRGCVEVCALNAGIPDGQIAFGVPAAIGERGGGAQGDGGSRCGGRGGHAVLEVAARGVDARGGPAWREGECEGSKRDVVWPQHAAGQEFVLTGGKELGVCVQAHIRSGNKGVNGCCAQLQGDVPVLDFGPAGEAGRGPWSVAEGWVQQAIDGLFDIVAQEVWTGNRGLLRGQMTKGIDRVAEGKGADPVEGRRVARDGFAGAVGAPKAMHAHRPGRTLDEMCVLLNGLPGDLIGAVAFREHAEAEGDGEGVVQLDAFDA